MTLAHERAEASNMTYEDAIIAARDAVRAAIAASADTTKYPDIHRQSLRLMAAELSRMSEQGKQSGLHPSLIEGAD